MTTNKVHVRAIAGEWCDNCGQESDVIVLRFKSPEQSNLSLALWLCVPCMEKSLCSWEKAHCSDAPKGRRIPMTTVKQPSEVAMQAAAESLIVVGQQFARHYNIDVSTQPISVSDLAAIFDRHLERERVEIRATVKWMVQLIDDDNFHEAKQRAESLLARMGEK